jgi:hypothetical protein
MSAVTPKRTQSPKTKRLNMDSKPKLQNSNTAEQKFILSRNAVVAGVSPSGSFDATNLGR